MNGDSTIDFRSDNTAGIAPEILDAISAANHGSALAYGGDAITEELQAVVRRVFGNPDLHIFPVASGTAANALGLAAICPPWGAIFCHESAHIITNKGGASSALSGGALMRGLGGDNGLIDPDELRAELGRVRWGDNHQSQPTVLSLTQPSDVGTVYPADHITTLSEIASEYNLAVHLDGARLANAVAALGCTPNAITVESGVTTFSLGAIKNGTMSADAIVTSEERVANELIYRTKRAGHVTSKMRFQSAQLLAYLADDLWIHLAAHANQCMKRLVSKVQQADLGDRFKLAYPAEANIAFFECSPADAQLLRMAGLLFYSLDGRPRFVTSWTTRLEDVDRAARVIADTLQA